MQTHPLALYNAKQNAAAPCRAVPCHGSRCTRRQQAGLVENPLSRSLAGAFWCCAILLLPPQRGSHKSAQGNALGDNHAVQEYHHLPAAFALKGQNNIRRVAPLQGSNSPGIPAVPGRCPGLACRAPSGRCKNRAIPKLALRAGMCAARTSRALHYPSQARRRDVESTRDVPKSQRARPIHTADSTSTGAVAARALGKRMLYATRNSFMTWIAVYVISTSHHLIPCRAEV